MVLLRPFLMALMLTALAAPASLAGTGLYSLQAASGGGRAPGPDGVVALPVSGPVGLGILLAICILAGAIYLRRK